MASLAGGGNPAFLREALSPHGDVGRQSLTPHDPLPRHRPEGRKVRAPRQRRDGAGDRLQRESRRAGARLHGDRLSVAARRRSRRRRRREDARTRRRSTPSSGGSANGMKVQLGGGIRDRAAIDNWLEKGVARVILGTAALRDPDLVRDAARENPKQDRRRHRRARRQGRGRGLDGDLRHRGARAREALRGRRRCGDHLHRHRPRRRADRRSTGRRRSRSPTRSRSRSSPRAALPRWPTSSACLQPDAAKLEGAITGRALYDGRIDARAALAMLGKVAAR